MFLILIKGMLLANRINLVVIVTGIWGVPRCLMGLQLCGGKDLVFPVVGKVDWGCRWQWLWYVVFAFQIFWDYGDRAVAKLLFVVI